MYVHMIREMTHLRGGMNAAQLKFASNHPRTDTDSDLENPITQSININLPVGVTHQHAIPSSTDIQTAAATHGRSRRVDLSTSLFSLFLQRL